MSTSIFLVAFADGGMVPDSIQSGTDAELGERFAEFARNVSEGNPSEKGVFLTLETFEALQREIQSAVSAADGILPPSISL